VTTFAATRIEHSSVKPGFHPNATQTIAFGWKPGLILLIFIIEFSSGTT